MTRTASKPASWQTLRCRGTARTIGAALLVSLAGPAVAQNNIAPGKPVSASGPIYGGQFVEHLNDQNLDNQTHPLASSGTLGFTYELDLVRMTTLDRIELVNRSTCCPERLSNYRVTVFADGGGTPGIANWSADIRTDGSNSGLGGRDVLTADLDPGGTFAGRYIHIINLSGAAYNPQIAELEVYDSPVPTISFFMTNVGNITRTGDPGLPTSATLSWNVAGADTVTISGVGPVAVSGSVAVAPAMSTDYTLTATNTAGTVISTLLIGVDEPVIPPVLTEFMASNSGLISDPDGDSPDWLEIHNPNPFTLNLDGYYLTDNPGVPTKWRIPSVSVPAQGYLVIFASSKDLTDPTQTLHTNFSLSAAGEYLALIAADGFTVLGQFPDDYPATPAYPPQRENRSYGLVGLSTAAFFDPATPGAANGTGFIGFVEDTTFTVKRGFFTNPINVQIATATAGATIRYTTDGSAPGATHGTVYSGAIPISSTTVLRAIASKSGFAPTNIDTQTYIFPADVITSAVMSTVITQHPTYGPQMTAALTSLPVVSLVAPGSINGSSEIPASIEMIFPDGSTGFQEDCGVRNYGGAFTNFPKKNFRLYFRSQYGASRLKEPVMEGEERGGFLPLKSFDKLELRAGSHDMKQRGFYLSNRFTDDIMLDMGNINPHGKFVHLYLNGTYWGMYHLRERWDADMLSHYLGGPKEEYESINGNWNVGGWAEPVVSAYDGDGSAWEQIKSLRDNYQAVRPYLDVAHYIDYMLMFMYGNSEDEYRCVGPNDVGSGFKWLLNDADGFTRDVGDRTTRDSPGRKNGDGPGSLFSMLFAEGDPDYRTLLADRIHRHFFNDGAMTPARMTARLQQRVAETQLAMISEIARWRGSGSTDSYLLPSEWVNKKDSYISGVLPTQTSDVLNFYRNAGFYPATPAPVFNQHGGDVPSGFTVSLTGAPGTILYTIDGTDPRLPGGAVNPGAFSSPGALQLTGNTIIRTRALNGGQWSALNEAFFTVAGALPVAAGDLVVSELHFNPAGSDDSEFIELLNVADHSINLRGVRFSDGIEYAFSDTFDTPLAPGQRVLLVSDLFTFQQVHGIDLTVAGVYFGNFDNGGEVVVIETAGGTQLLNFAYSDEPPWPTDADGTGQSLVFIPTRPGTDPNDPLNWRTSVIPGGTPMTTDRFPFTGDPSADLDGNGVADAVDYAFGTPAGSTSNLQVSIDPDGHVLFFVPRALGADDAMLDLESSTDLATWSDASARFVLVTRVSDGSGLETLGFRSIAPLNTHPDRWFVRVRITIP